MLLEELLNPLICPLRQMLYLENLRHPLPRIVSIGWVNGACLACWSMMCADFGFLQVESPFGSRLGYPRRLSIVSGATFSLLQASTQKSPALAQGNCGPSGHPFWSQPWQTDYLSLEWPYWSAECVERNNSCYKTSGVEAAAIP